MKYLPVEWPYVQDLFEIPGFRENSYLINDDKGYEDFGDSAYFVSLEFLQTDEEDDAYLLVDWPESQRYEDIEGFYENSYPSGNGAVFIAMSWIKNI